MIIILVLVLLVALLLFAVVSSNPGSKTPPKKGKNRVGHVDHRLVSERWLTIQATAATGGNGLRHAVSEADKLLDYVMKGSGYRGNTMADRLRHAQKKLSDRNATWEAHKLRNALAHEVGFDLVPTQAKQALAAFEQALRDLGGLK